MTDVNQHTYTVKQSSGSDGLSCTSEDNKRRIRKMIEVTRSTRYTTFVEGDNGTNDPSLVPSNVGGSRKDFFTTSMAVMDSSLGNIQEAIGDDKYQFGVKCHDKAGQFMERLQKIEEKVEECAKTAEKRQHLSAKVRVKRGQIKEKLQGLLEVSRKKRSNREKILTSLMKKMS